MDLESRMNQLEADLREERRARRQLERTIKGLQQLLIKAGEYEGREQKGRLP